MREIKFTEIGMENYGPYEEPFVLECPEDSLTLITGPNGVGKTIALDSMGFTFYGITSKGERGDDVVNNTAKKNCHTWVKFQADDVSYVVDRYHKHSKFKNTVHITRNGESKPYKVGHREVTAEIDKLICDRKTFTNTLMFGQKVKDFFTDLPDTEQKSIFWKLLDLLKYSFWKKTAKLEIDKIDADNQKVKNNIEVAMALFQQIGQQMEEENKKSLEYEENKKVKVEQHQSQIAELEVLTKTTQDALAQLPAANLKEVQERSINLKNEFENLGKDAGVIKKDVESKAYKKVNELTASRNDKQQEISKRYQNLLEDINKEGEVGIAKFQTQMDECNKQIADLQSKKATAEALTLGNLGRINELKSSHLIVGSECPTCLESITEDSIKNIQCIINEHIVKNKEHELTLAAITVDTDKHQKTKSDIVDARTETNKRFSKKRLDLQDAEKIEDIVVEKKLKALKQQVADVANQTLKERIKDLEMKAAAIKEQKEKADEELATVESTDNKKKELEKSITEYQVKIQSLRDQITYIEEKEFDESNLKQLKINKHKQLETLQKSNAKIAETELEVTRLKFWQEAYSQRGIPSMLIDQAIPLMNKSMRKYLDLLSNGRYIVTFDTITQTKGGEYRDKFSVNVLDTKTQVTNRKQLSGGQTRLIDIATILTLRDLKKELGNVNFNLFAFDEIFDALDDMNIGYVCNILNTLKENRSLLIVSHRHQDGLEADEHIQLT
jgi:DNA repair exonuclease SbcCD ATPase subunit